MLKKVQFALNRKRPPAAQLCAGTNGLNIFYFKAIRVDWSGWDTVTVRTQQFVN